MEREEINSPSWTLFPCTDQMNNVVFDSVSSPFNYLPHASSTLTTKHKVSFSVYLVNLQVSDTLWCQKYIYTFQAQIILFSPQPASAVIGQLTVRDIHKMNEIPANSNGYPDNRRPRVDALISAWGIRSSENWMRQSPNGLMLISISADYRKKNWEGVECGRYF